MQTQNIPPAAQSWAMQQAGQAVMNAAGGNASSQQPAAAAAGGGGGAGVDPVRQQPWWFKYATKGLGTLAGVLAIGLGAFNCITITPSCLVAGIWQILVGFMVVIFEAPYLCMFLDFVQNISAKLNDRPLFIKAGVYVVAAIPAVLMCANASIIIGSGLVFASGVLYGLLALGKKASRDEMSRSAAANDGAPIVTNAHPMGMA